MRITAADIQRSNTEWVAANGNWLKQPVESASEQVKKYLEARRD